MPHNKSHHYVPRFYLKRFSVDKRHVNLYNLKSRKRIQWAKLSKQCCQDYFYGKQGSLEKVLALTETEIAALMRGIDDAKMPPPFGSPEHFALIVHILMQHGRTKYMADAMNEVVDQTMKLIYGEHVKEKLGIDLEQFKIGFTDTSRFAVGTTVSAYPLLMDLRAKLLIDSTGVGFITSDNPLVLYNQLLGFRDGGSNCGLSSKGLQIFLPLDKGKLILLYDDASYRVGSDSRNVIEIDNPNDVHELNTLQMCSAYENVYFTDLTFAVEPLHRKALPHMRSTKVVIRRTLPRLERDGKTSQLIGSAMSDIRTNLSVSFITLRKSARRWREEFRRKKLQPLLINRSEALFRDFRDFQAACERKEYIPSEFIKFMHERKEGRGADARPDSAGTVPGESRGGNGR